MAIANDWFSASDRAKQDLGHAAVRLLSSGFAFPHYRIHRVGHLRDELCGLPMEVAGGPGKCCGLHNEQRHPCQGTGGSRGGVTLKQGQVNAVMQLICPPISEPQTAPPSWSDQRPTSSRKLSP